MRVFLGLWDGVRRYEHFRGAVGSMLATEDSAAKVGKVDQTITHRVVHERLLSVDS
jgi:hypothetical protein